MSDTEYKFPAFPSDCASVELAIITTGNPKIYKTYYYGRNRLIDNPHPSGYDFGIISSSHLSYLKRTLIHDDLNAIIKMLNAQIRFRMEHIWSLRSLLEAAMDEATEAGKIPELFEYGEPTKQEWSDAKFKRKEFMELLPEYIVLSRASYALDAWLINTNAILKIVHQKKMANSKQLRKLKS